MNLSLMQKKQVRLYSINNKKIIEHGALVEWYWQGKLKYLVKTLFKCHFVNHHLQLWNNGQNDYQQKKLRVQHYKSLLLPNWKNHRTEADRMFYLCWPSESHFADIWVCCDSCTCCWSIARDYINYTFRDTSLQTRKILNTWQFNLYTQYAV